MATGKWNSWLVLCRRFRSITPLHRPSAMGRVVVITASQSPIRLDAPSVKTPCPECAASSVWVAVAKVTRERGGALVMQWRCTLCAHEWGVETPRTKPPRATLRPRPARRRRA